MQAQVQAVPAPAAPAERGARKLNLKALDQKYRPTLFVALPSLPLLLTCDTEEPSAGIPYRAGSIPGSGRDTSGEPGEKCLWNGFSRAENPKRDKRGNAWPFVTSQVAIVGGVSEGCRRRRAESRKTNLTCGGRVQSNSTVMAIMTPVRAKWEPDIKINLEPATVAQQRDQRAAGSPMSASFSSTIASAAFTASASVMCVESSSTASSAGRRGESARFRSR
jgi:hypothetical protein